jgi:signal transduction histidine kinase
VVAVLVATMKISLAQVSASEARYRSLIALSSEAVWRVELAAPMPVTLPPPARLQWLREHAAVAESNAVFNALSDACTEPHVDHGQRWQPQRSWCALFEKNLENAASQSWSLRNLRMTTQISGKARSFMVTFSGVVADGHLQRIWCVAHDISEIQDLNTRLVRERERLKAYAHQLLNAEERARRATAMDLHDGIGQTLTGMAMSLEVARMQAPQVAPLLDDVRTNLRRVQDRTRSMIADLSPPGLYELGLGPALQWLAVQFRSQEKLRVQLDCEIEEEAVGMELRVLIFKLVRELLRNVVKHSGVDSARVEVRGERMRLRVEVEDTGRGFEWQMEMFGPRPGSFGLWSFADRVRDMGGEFEVDSAPGKGSRFRMEFPLSR